MVYAAVRCRSLLYIAGCCMWVTFSLNLHIRPFNYHMGALSLTTIWGHFNLPWGPACTHVTKSVYIHFQRTLRSSLICPCFAVLASELTYLRIDWDDLSFMICCKFLPLWGDLCHFLVSVSVAMQWNSVVFVGMFFHELDQWWTLCCSPVTSVLYKEVHD